MFNKYSYTDLMNLKTIEVIGYLRKARHNAKRRIFDKVDPETYVSLACEKARFISKREKDLVSAKQVKQLCASKKIAQALYMAYRMQIGETDSSPEYKQRMAAHFLEMDTDFDLETLRKQFIDEMTAIIDSLESENT